MNNSGNRFHIWMSAIGIALVLSVALPPPAAADPSRLVTMDFNNVELPAFIKFMSELTGKNFIVDEKVKGKITIYSPKKITSDEAYQIFLSVLENNGYATVPVGEAVHVLPSSEVSSGQAVHVYYLKNASAEDLVKILSGLVGGSGKPSARRTKARTTQEFEGPVRLFAHQTTNALLITASPRDFETLRGIIEKLDIPLRQVYVEAVIMEITLNKLREIGVEIQSPVRTDASGQLLETVQGIGGTNFDGISSFATQGPVSMTGLAVGVVSGTFEFQGQKFLNVGALLRALQSDTDVNILSTPQILTSDNQKAEIIVGENRPFVTGQSQTVGGNVLTTIERRDVGITLRLTPRVMENNRITLDLYQEISTISDSVAQTVGTTVVGPTTNKRSASTKIIVGDKQTVVVGGLIRDNVNKSVHKVPLLGDIPGLKWLFRFQTERTEKTNLLIFLTPYIVHESDDITRIREQKTRQMQEFIERERIDSRKSNREALEKFHAPAVSSTPHGTAE